MMYKIRVEQIRVIGKKPDQLYDEISDDVRKLVRDHNDAVKEGDLETVAGTYNRFAGFVQALLYMGVVVKWELEGQSTIH